MRALFCGDRNWKNQDVIDIVMRGLCGHAVEYPTIIHGCAPGADTLAGRTAKSLGLSIEEFPALWSEYGKAAGPIRNQQMLDEGRPDVVFAFKSGFDWSLAEGGTEDMVTRTRAADIPTYVISEAE